LVSIQGSSSEINILNNEGQLTMLMSFEQYNLGETKVRLQFRCK